MQAFKIAYIRGQQHAVLGAGSNYVISCSVDHVSHLYLQLYSYIVDVR